MHQRPQIAVGKDYFGLSGFPLTVKQVSTDAEHTPSHPHDLTEVEHAHDFHELTIVRRGSAMHQLEGSAFPVTAGDVFLLQGKQRHFFYARENLDLLNIMYDPEEVGLPENELRRLPGYCAMFLLEPAYRRQHRFASHLHLRRIPLAKVEAIALEMERECVEQSPGYEALLLSKLTELFVYLSRLYVESDATEARALLRVGKVIGTLEENYTQDWSVLDLLRIAHMSQSNFMRVFKRATGQSPIEYLIRLRIQEATRLLRTTDRTVTEIAFDVGFQDSNYFSRQFKQALGISPRAYRKQGG